MHKDHKFFSWNFHGRNFYPPRNFWEKPTNGIFQKWPKSTFDRKNPFFPWDRKIWTQYQGLLLKLYKHNFSRLQNIKLGKIGRNIEKSKKIVFPIFGQKSPKWILRAKIQKALTCPKTFYNPFWDQKTLQATCFDPQNMFLCPRDQYFDFWEKSFFGWFCRIPKSSNSAKSSKKSKKTIFLKNRNIDL